MIFMLQTIWYSLYIWWRGEQMEPVMFKPHDDHERDDYPVLHWLRCQWCKRTKLIRTSSYQQLRRTARRTGWRWIDWPVGGTAKVLTCKKCFSNHLKNGTAIRPNGKDQ